MMNPYIQLPRVPMLVGRQDWVVERCTRKRVLHLGCADAALGEERLPRGQLLHQKLRAVSQELWGVDIDADSVSFLRGQGFDNLVVGDICQLNAIEPLRGRAFDAIVITEVLEHLPSPGLFLQSLRAFLLEGNAEAIISVPNAYRVATLLGLLRGIEYVHPDHNFCFSYHTATTLLRRCGFRVEEVYVYAFPARGILTMLRSFARRPVSDEAGAVPRLPPSSGGIQRASLLKRFLSRADRLFWRALTALLYRTTPFWGDGLIIVARAAHSDQ